MRLRQLEEDVDAQPRPPGRLAAEKKQLVDSIGELEAFIKATWPVGSEKSRADQEEPAATPSTEDITDILNATGCLENPLGSWVDLSADAGDDGPVDMDLCDNLD